MSTYIFGDSFAGVFKLVNDKNVRVHKYKGATMRGLSKPDNENRIDIINKIKQAHNLRCIIFVFGNVDVHLSYYYLLAKENRIIDFKKIAGDYIQFIADLHVPRGTAKVVLGVFPSPLKTRYVINSLVIYHAIESTVSEADALKLREVDPTAQIPLEPPEHIRKIIEPHINSAARYARMQTMNSHLYELARPLGIEYYDITADLTGARSARAARAECDVAEKYVDMSKLNIHIRWEPMIPLWARKLHKYGIRLAPADAARMKRAERIYLHKKTLELKKHI